MLLWTIQHRAAYEKLQRDGILTADVQHSFYWGYENCRRAYDWMAQQLTQRVGPAPTGVQYPIWAWYQCEGQHKRPDMRSTYRYYGEKGTPICLLTLEVPDELVLLSDFDMWNIVLNGNYLALSSAEYHQPRAYDLPLEQSWERVFQWQLVVPYWDAPKTTQAVFWMIKAEWVRKVEFFKSL